MVEPHRMLQKSCLDVKPCMWFNEFEQNTELGCSLMAHVQWITWYSFSQQIATFEKRPLVHILWLGAWNKASWSDLSLKNSPNHHNRPWDLVLSTGQVKMLILAIERSRRPDCSPEAHNDSSNRPGSTGRAHPEQKFPCGYGLWQRGTCPQPSAMIWQMILYHCTDLDGNWLELRPSNPWLV